MIALIRRKLLHSYVYKVFILSVVALMGVSSMMFLFQVEEKKDWVISVYDQGMSDFKFKSMLAEAKQRQEMFRQKGFVFANANIPKETVLAAVGSLLSLHALKKIALIVPKSHIDAAVQKQVRQLPPQFLDQNGNLNEEVFRQAIAPYTMEDFLSDIEIDAKNKVLFGLIDVAVYVPSFELDLQAISEFANKVYSYITLPYHKYLNTVKEAQPSTEMLQKFYKQASVADGFKTAERRSGDMWVFDGSNFEAKISDAEAKSFYDKNKVARYVVTPAQMQIRTIRINVRDGNDAEAKTKITEIREELEKNPSEFESFAKRLSDDKLTALRGGLSDFFSRDDKKINKAIVDTAFEFLAEDNQISSPIKVDNGYEIIQRVKKHAALYKDFKSVESEIKKDLGAERFKKRFAQDASRVVNGAKYNPSLMEKFVERYAGKRFSIALSERKSGLEYTYLFKTEEGRYATFFDKNMGIVIQCSKVEKSFLPALSDVHSQVLSMYYKSKAIEMMKDDLALAYKDALTMSMNDVAAKYGITLQRASFSYNDGKAEQSAILKEAAVASRVKGMVGAGAIAQIVTKDDGIAIRLDSVESVNDDVLREQKNHLRSTLFYTKLYQIKEGFIASLYRTAKLNNKVEINPAILSLTKEV